MKRVDYELRGVEVQDVAEMQDMTIQVADLGSIGGGPQNLEGSIDGLVFSVIQALTTTTGIVDVDVKKLSVVRLAAAGTLTDARITISGFNVRGDS